jgi:hypothetical protein
MATIRPNDNAPSDAVKYIFPLETFDLAPGGEHETEDRNTLSAAEAHPWLEVEYPEIEELAVTRGSRSVPYSEDVLAAPNSQAFDVEAVRAALPDDQRWLPATAVEASLDQGEVVQEGGVALTLAADEAQDDEPANDDEKGEE